MSGRVPSIHSIQQAVAQTFRLPVLELWSERQTRAVVIPRHAAQWLARHLTMASLPEIAHAFGHRDHTTVLAAIRRHESRMAADPELAEVTWSLVAELADSPQTVIELRRTRITAVPRGLT